MEDRLLATALAGPILSQASNSTRAALLTTGAVVAALERYVRKKSEQGSAWTAAQVMGWVSILSLLRTAGPRHAFRIGKLLLWFNANDVNDFGTYSDRLTGVSDVCWGKGGRYAVVRSGPLAHNYVSLYSPSGTLLRRSKRIAGVYRCGFTRRGLCCVRVGKMPITRRELNDSDRESFQYFGFPTSLIEAVMFRSLGDYREGIVWLGTKLRWRKSEHAVVHTSAADAALDLNWRQLASKLGQTVDVVEQLKGLVRSKVSDSDVAEITSLSCHEDVVAIGTRASCVLLYMGMSDPILIRPKNSSSTRGMTRVCVRHGFVTCMFDCSSEYMSYELSSGTRRWVSRPANVSCICNHNSDILSVDGVSLYVNEDRSCLMPRATHLDCTSDGNVCIGFETGSVMVGKMFGTDFEAGMCLLHACPLFSISIDSRHGVLCSGLDSPDYSYWTTKGVRKRGPDIVVSYAYKNTDLSLTLDYAENSPVYTSETHVMYYFDGVRILQRGLEVRVPDRSTWTKRHEGLLWGEWEPTEEERECPWVDKNNNYRVPESVDMYTYPVDHLSAVEAVFQGGKWHGTETPVATLERAGPREEMSGKYLNADKAAWQRAIERSSPLKF